MFVYIIMFVTFSMLSLVGRRGSGWLVSPACYQLLSADQVRLWSGDISV